MATTTKTTATKTTAQKKPHTTSTKVKANTDAVDKTKAENEALKAQMAEMEAKMKVLMEQMSIASQPAQTSVKKDKDITFVNMTKGSVVLKGSQVWSIEGQFNTRKFSEREANVIVNNMRNCINSGTVYITDEEFVREHDLLDAYQYILSDKDLKELLSRDSSYVIDAYKMVSDGQKEIILDMVKSNRLNGIDVDANILFKLSELSGKDLVKIEPLED